MPQNESSVIYIRRDKDETNMPGNKIYAESFQAKLRAAPNWTQLVMLAIKYEARIEKHFSLSTSNLNLHAPSFVVKEMITGVVDMDLWQPDDVYVKENSAKSGEPRKTHAVSIKVKLRPAQRHHVTGAHKSSDHHRHPTVNSPRPEMRCTLTHCGAILKKFHLLQDPPVEILDHSVRFWQTSPKLLTLTQKQQFYNAESIEHLAMVAPKSDSTITCLTDHSAWPINLSPPLIPNTSALNGQIHGITCVN